MKAPAPHCCFGDPCQPGKLRDPSKPQHSLLLPESMFFLNAQHVFLYPKSPNLFPRHLQGAKPRESLESDMDKTQGTARAEASSSLPEPGDQAIVLWSKELGSCLFCGYYLNWSSLGAICRDGSIPYGYGRGGGGGVLACTFWSGRLYYTWVHGRLHPDGHHGSY